MKIDLNSLHDRCEASISDSFERLEADGGKIVSHKSRKFGFLDRGSSILAVAHLDYVWESSFWFTRHDGDIVLCPRLDDRLGVYTILDFLPRLGVSLDILLTEDEEIGMTSAKFFQPSKRYHWMVSFDRQGTDVVTYQYRWEKLHEYFKIGVGSYSDIADMGHLGCKGTNVGVGYHNEHTEYCYLSIREWHSQIAKFLIFYRDYKDRPQPSRTNIHRGIANGRHPIHHRLPRQHSAGRSR
jgi:hypothetical protein